MAGTFYVAEFTEEQVGPAGRVGQMPMNPSVTEYTLATGAVSAAFNTKTRFLRLHAQTNGMSYLVSAAGTAATTTNTRLAQNQTEYIGVPFGTGLGFKIAVIDNT